MIIISVLVLMNVLNVNGENTTTEEAEEIKSLSAVKTLQIFGDLITVVAKNESKSGSKNFDDFDFYLRNHLIRIKSPLEDEKYFDFELSDLIFGNELEGREKRDKRKGPIREILIPLLLALKYKSTVVLPLLMMMITFIAFKSFWAGMTGLVISKVVGLKVLLDTLNKRTEEHDEDAGQDQVFYDSPHQNEEEIDRNDRPVVVYLHSRNRRRLISKRHEKSSKNHKNFRWESRRKQRDSEHTSRIKKPFK